MNLKSHVMTAVLLAIATAYYLQYERIFLFGIVIGSMLPDIIEPATSRFHRKFWHSRRIMNALLLLIIVSFLASLESESFFWLFFMLIGYELHLLGDLFFYGLPK